MTALLFPLNLHNLLLQMWTIESSFNFVPVKKNKSRFKYYEMFPRDMILNVLSARLNILLRRLENWWWNPTALAAGRSNRLTFEKKVTLMAVKNPRTRAALKREAAWFHTDPGNDTWTESHTKQQVSLETLRILGVERSRLTWSTPFSVLCSC